MKWFVLVCVLAGCTQSNSVTCLDGRICPSDTVCDDTHEFCVTEEQSTVCVGKPDGEECTAGAIEGHRLDSICLPYLDHDGCASGVRLRFAPPNARYAHTMAWDAARRTAVVYGGYNGAIVGDTWVGAFDTAGTTWQWAQKTPTTTLARCAKRRWALTAHG